MYQVEQQSSPSLLKLYDSDSKSKFKSSKTCLSPDSSTTSLTNNHREYRDFVQMPQFYTIDAILCHERHYQTCVYKFSI